MSNYILHLERVVKNVFVYPMLNVYVRTKNPGIQVLLYGFPIPFGTRTFTGLVRFLKRF